MYTHQHSDLRAPLVLSQQENTEYYTFQCIENKLQNDIKKNVT